MTEAAAEPELTWAGGSLDELLAALAEPSLSARIQAVLPATGESIGEVHVVAGGVAETRAGGEIGDEALSFLRKVPGLTFAVTPCLPHPDEGGLDPPGPRQGNLVDRPVATLMRYCEDFVLTCTLELSRGEDRATIAYRRGEITSTVVNGSDSAEGLTQVLAWTEGSWQIALGALPITPPTPAPRRTPAASAAVAPVAAARLPSPPAMAAAAPAPRPRRPESPFGEAPHADTALAAASSAALARLEARDDMIQATPPATTEPHLGDSRRVRRGYTTLPVAFHLLVGVVLGIAVVGGYWLYLQYGGTLGLP